MSTTDIRDAAPAVGYPGAVDALHDTAAPGRLVASPTGHLLASVAALPHAAPGPLHRFGLAVADAGPESAFGAGRAADRFADGLLRLHHDVLRRALRHAMAHLGARTSEGATLLAKQLVQAQLADIAMALAQEDGVPTVRRQADRYARWRSHRRMVDVGRRTLRLFGASGYLADGLAVDLHLAEVTGNVYLHPGTEDHDG